MDDDKASRRFNFRERQSARENPALAFIGSVAGFVLGLFTNSLQIAGVISVGVAHILMLLACLVSVISVWSLGFYGYAVKSRLIAIAILFVFFVGADLWMMKKRAELDMANALSIAPDVGLCLVYPDGPALQVINLSDVVAREMKYVVMLWNLDLPTRTDPLPIPVAAFDWLKPHRRGGPQNLFSTSIMEPLLHSGDRLIGSMSVNCPECIRGRIYVVSIIWKQGGWFAEIPDAKEVSYFSPTSNTREGIVALGEELSSRIPEHSRIPIKVQCP